MKTAYSKRITPKIRQYILGILLRCKSYKIPESPEHAALFLVSEQGEAADALSRTWSGYTRGTPDKAVSLSEELADVVIMACVTAYVSDIDIDQAILDKMEEMKQRCAFA
jgi:NTP pyrophosphatase (non-canonical NTP hydrolase)